MLSGVVNEWLVEGGSLESFCGIPALEDIYFVGGAIMYSIQV